MLKVLSIKNSFCFGLTGLLMIPLLMCATKQGINTFDPKHDPNYREVTDLTLLREILLYRDMEARNYDSVMVVVYVFSDSYFEILPIHGVSRIYNSPFSYFTLIDNEPVLFYDQRQSFVDPFSVDSALFRYFGNFLRNDILSDSYFFKTELELKGSDTVSVQRKLPEVIRPLSFDPIVWGVKINGTQVKRDTVWNYQRIHNYHYIRDRSKP